MRILAGTARGVPLLTTPGCETRPILDRLKKSLFSILENAGLLGAARVLDLYAGTGTLGLEALSRGAQHCLFVEQRREATALLRRNLEKSRLADRATVREAATSVVLRELVQAPPACLLVLYDPPFAFSREAEHRQALENEMALAGQLLLPEGCLVLRCESCASLPSIAGLALRRRWTDGRHAFGFYSP